MDEKRLSIRFRMDNEQDRKTWDLLKRISEEENTSKNAIAIGLICKGAEGTDANEKGSLDVVAQTIAELVVNKLVESAGTIENLSMVSREPESNSQQESQDGDLRPISAEALSFLDEF